jgi:hypothetical protein
MHTTLLGVAPIVMVEGRLLLNFSILQICRSSTRATNATFVPALDRR